MRAIALVAVFGCGSAAPTPVTPVDPNAAIAIDIASVSLAEDCGAGAQPADPVRPRTPSPSSAQPDDGDAPSEGEAACEQTTLQLSIRAKSAGKIAIKRVELLAADGKRVGTLRSRSPSKWVSGDYQPWNERVEPGQTTASYALSQPDWDKLSKGRDPSVAYRVRVVIEVDGAERVFDKQATVEAPAYPMPEGVVT